MAQCGGVGRGGTGRGGTWRCWAWGIVTGGKGAPGGTLHIQPANMPMKTNRMGSNMGTQGVEERCKGGCEESCGEIVS